MGYRKITLLSVRQIICFVHQLQAIDSRTRVQQEHSGVTRLLLMPGQRAGKPPTRAAHIHMSIFIWTSVIFSKYVVLAILHAIYILAITLVVMTVPSLGYGGDPLC